MYKKIISLCLVFCMTLGIVNSVFAANNNIRMETKIDNGVEKTILYMGNNKIVSWDDGDYVYSEQYDLDGNFIVSTVGNRNNGQIVITNDEGTYTKSAEDIVSVISTYDLPILYAFSKIATIPVINMTTSDKQTMYLYEEIGSASTTTYKVKVYNGDIANFLSSLAVGLKVPAIIASAVISAIVSAGLAVISSKVIDITSSKILAASKYSLSYYGKDSKTNQKSDTMKNRGDKYVITETGSKLINETYYEGYTYNPKDKKASLKLLSYIVPNLYGANYEWDNY